MNPAAILALIADLYAQVTALTEENRALREQVAPGSQPSGKPASPAGGTEGAAQTQVG